MATASKGTINMCMDMCNSSFKIAGVPLVWVAK